MQTTPQRFNPQPFTSTTRNLSNAKGGWVWTKGQVPRKKRRESREVVERRDGVVETLRRRAWPFRHGAWWEWRVGSANRTSSASPQQTAPASSSPTRR